jgi:hypothetical protein
MCRCTPEIRTPFCGKPGCEAPAMSEEELQKRLDALFEERVTAEYITSRIAAVDFHRLAPTLTLCTIRLDNGYVATGESACVHPGNYNSEIGDKLAYDAAFRKLWPLFGFLLAERRFQDSRPRTWDYPIGDPPPYRPREGVE